MHAFTLTEGNSGPRPDDDQLIYLDGLTWTDYEVLLAVKGERAVPRMAYLEGRLELMSPSRRHEQVKTNAGRLLEMYAALRSIRMSGFGSWTVKKAEEERGVEPDECYEFAEVNEDRPDLAIEIVHKGRLLDKLEIYRGLGVPEVWIWKDERFQIHQLHGESYVAAVRSRFLPDLDVSELARFVRMPSQPEAVQAFMEWVRQHSA